MTVDCRECIYCENYKVVFGRQVCRCAIKCRLDFWKDHNQDWKRLGDTCFIPKISYSSELEIDKLKKLASESNDEKEIIKCKDEIISILYKEIYKLMEDKEERKYSSL